MGEAQEVKRPRRYPCAVTHPVTPIGARRPWPPAVRPLEADEPGLALDAALGRRIAAIRRERGYTQTEQTELAEQVGVRTLQIGRYEKGSAQPTLEVIRKLAVALGVTADELIFDQDERGPDQELRLQFEAVSRMSPEEKRVVKELIEGMILKHEVRRWATSEAK